MEWIVTFNLVMAILFTALYAYQYVYLIVASFRKPKTYPDVEPSHRYAILISARNEENVIGQLLDSIREQDYPTELLDAYVVADNCTDSTHTVAEEHGATVFARHNMQKVGKGYALDYLLRCIRKLKGKDYYDGFFVIDADNLLDRRYVREMDKCFSAGNRIVTSYRNSKNYGDNWISSGYSLWFLHEARHLNNARTLLGTSCAISGTGFLVCKDIINKQGGWKHYLLTEDIEFTIDNIIKGEKITYCHAAMLYDEQPKKFSQSWHQRLRWSKGFLQVIRKHGGQLLKGIFTGKGFSFYDMFCTVAPMFFISSVAILVNAAAFIYGIINPSLLNIELWEVAKTCASVYLLMFIIGASTGIYEWKNIHAPAWKKILSFFTFPIFMATYIPISWVAFLTKVTWKPIAHTTSVSLNEVENSDLPDSGDDGTGIPAGTDVLTESGAVPGTDSAKAPVTESAPATDVSVGTATPVPAEQQSGEESRTAESVSASPAPTETPESDRAVPSEIPATAGNLGTSGDN